MVMDWDMNIWPQCLFKAGFFAWIRACPFGTACLQAQDVFCPRKPNQFGNGYHTLCCAMSGMLTQIELAEGKGHPKEMGNDKDKTVGLLLCLLEPYFTSGCYVVHNLRFYVLKRIVELTMLLTKKHRYWPTLVLGHAIYNNRQNGECDVFSVVLDKMYFVWKMKEPDYVMNHGKRRCFDLWMTTARKS